MSTLFLFGDQLNEDSCLCLRLDKQGLVDLPMAVRTIQEIRSLQGLDQTLVILPTSVATLHRINLPWLSDQKSRAAIPYALEDQLAQPVDSIHVSFDREHYQDGHYLVVAIDKLFLSNLIEQLDSYGLRFEKITIDWFALNNQEACITEKGLLVNDNFFKGMLHADVASMYLANPDHLATIITFSDSNPILKKIGKDRTQNNFRFLRKGGYPLDAFGSEKSAGVPWSIEHFFRSERVKRVFRFNARNGSYFGRDPNYPGIPSMPTSRGLSAGSSDVSISLDPADEPRDVDIGRSITKNESDNTEISYVWMAQRLLQANSINLCQGELRHDTHKYGVKHWYIGCAALASICVLSALFFNACQLYLLTKKTRVVDQEIAVVYKHFFPGAQQIISPRFRVEQLLKSNGSADSSSTLWTLMDKFGLAFTDNPLTIEHTHFQGKALSVTLIAKDFADLEKLELRLQKEHVKVTQSQAGTRDKQVVATLELTL